MNSKRHKAQTHLDLSPAEQRIIHSQRRFNKVLRSELDVGESFRVAIHLVAQNCNTVHAAASVEMRFQLFGSRSVINVADVHGPIVDLLLLLDGQRQWNDAGGTAECHLFVHLRLHLLQLLRLLLHLLDSSLDRLQLRVELLRIIL